MQWYRMDLHLHTPASSDYQQDGVVYLDILQQAERMGLQIMAFTDHNTVRGYREMAEEIERLNWLDELKRITPEEQRRLCFLPTSRSASWNTSCLT
jgi:histidinol phosphatase-like PHP family hydrolase